MAGDNFSYFANFCYGTGIYLDSVTLLYVHFFKSGYFLYEAYSVLHLNKNILLTQW